MNRDGTDDGCIALMVRYPRKGRVKSRLARDLGEVPATNLYRRFVEDMVDVLDASGVGYLIAHTPDADRKAMEAWLGSTADFITQVGSDLGQRLESVLSRCFELGKSRSAALGSDTPDLDPEVLREAMFSLERHDAVLGPCADGGYYLIGFRREAFEPEVFRNIPWSTSRVLSMTIDSLERSGTDYRLLPEWQDIDTLNDLEQFRLRQSSWGRRTRAYLESAEVHLR